jgi:Lrp/AsnC family transcriptional regulator, leucine-responsive regulatory protein
MNINLDVKNRKLLYELECNSRKPASLLAKKIGLSKAAVIYRMQQLEKNGIIEGYRAYIDFGKLGYTNIRLLLNLQRAPPEKEEEILNYLKTQEIVKSLFFMEGFYNVSLNLVTKDIIQVHLLWQNIRKKFLNYLGERSMSILVGQKYFTRAYLLENPKNKISIDQSSPPKLVSHDSLDLKIINSLASNARIPLIDIARKNGVTVKTAIKRIKILEQNKIIVRYGLLLDGEKIGYQRFRIHGTLMSMNENKIKEFSQFCTEHPNIVLEDEFLGGDDFEMELNVKGISQLRSLVSEFKSRFSEVLQDYKILHILKRFIKETPKLV